jgi:hypothetical protein
MLDFAVVHCKALDLLTQDHANGLRDFKLSEGEWKIVGELRDALKVRLMAAASFSHDLTVNATCWSLFVLSLTFAHIVSHLPHHHVSWPHLRNDHLQIFKDTTLFFSRGTLNLATVILAMDHIDKHLTTQSLNRSYSPPVRVALALGKTTLNRYYNLTDASEVYRIAMGMNLLPFIYLLTLSFLT